MVSACECASEFMCTCGVKATCERVCECECECVLVQVCVTCERVHMRRMSVWEGGCEVVWACQLVSACVGGVRV